MPGSIQLSDYHVSRDTGFLLENPQEYLPDYFEPWNRVAKRMPDLVSRHSMREAVEEMPLLDHSRLTGYRQKRLAHMQLVLITSGYLWQEGDAGVVQRLPECVAVPLWHVSNKLGLKPVICHPDMCLANWKYTEDQRDIEVIYTVPGGSSSVWFFKVTCFVEMAFAKGLQSVQEVLDGVMEDDNVKVTSGLTGMTITVGNMQSAMKRMHEHLSVPTFYNTVRPYLCGWGGPSSPLPNGLIFEGVSEKPFQVIGGSTAQSTTLQLMDILLGVTHSPDKQAFLNEMRNYMPPGHRQLLLDVMDMPRKLTCMVADSEDSELTTAYSKCLAAVTQFRSYHIQMVTKYVVSASKKGSRENSYLANMGTGGTDLLPFLKALRDDTKKAVNQQ
uniref:Molluscan indoleamine 2,3-dioxygenase like protein I n=1 Tax=Haliotis diversicolor TaxID=36095 RepID=Q6F3I3_HALDV|nr:molluscan indoleamine 2,3-dioxygenase like protein I [Haliotis diversicolor]BAD27567.1 molluscan indoleamine 2,3-dioxygenase like protein I [Haliotis diversicolor]